MEVNAGSCSVNKCYRPQLFANPTQHISRNGALSCCLSGLLAPFFVIISNIPDLSLQYDEQMNLLRIEWVSGADTRTLRQSAAQLLALNRELGARNLLLNMNTFPDISVYDQVWLGASWMPDIVKLPLERVVLINHRRRVHNQLAIDSLLAMFRSIIKFDIQYFPQPEPGLQWLADYSARLPELQAEWDAVYGPMPLAPVGATHPRI